MEAGLNRSLVRFRNGAARSAGLRRTRFHPAKSTAPPNFIFQHRQASPAHPLIDSTELQRRISKMLHGRLPRRRTQTFLLLALFAPAAPAFADLWATSVDPYGTGSPIDPTIYNKVFRFDTLGGMIEPDIDAGATGPIYPAGIAVAPNGNIYVSSIGTGSIMFYDGQTGSPLTLGANPSGLFATLGTAAPAQMSIGPDGKLYVSEFFGTNVRVFDLTTGDDLGFAVQGLESAGGLAFGPDGALYVGDGFVMGEGDSARIVRVEEGTPTTFGISDMGMLSSPTSLLFLPNGDLLVADVLGNYVGRFDNGGFGFAPFAFMPPEIPDPLPDGVLVPSNNPSDLNFDENGNVLVSTLGLTIPPDNRGAILRYALDGTPLAPLAEDLEPVGAIAWTRSPKTLVGDFDGDGDVDPDDYDKWKSDFGKWVAAGNGADGNGDGIVNAADYTVWRNNLSGSQDLGHAAGVPEPSAGLLAMIGLMLALGTRSKKMFRS
jgi:DNA-binding beta-propeller fold protein YncE